MPSTEYLTFLAYCAAGPGAWATYALGMRTGLRRLSLLNRAPEFDVANEDVLAVIPARNEVSNIERCIKSVLGQAGNAPQVLAIDDRSDDGTADILTQLANNHGDRLKVIKLEGEPAPGQTGKCAAIIRGLHQHPPAAKWLLFIDSDVVLQPPTLAAALRLALRGRDGESQAGHDLVSLLPRQECSTLAERAGVPLFAAATVALWGVAYANSDLWPRHAFACGQFLLIRRDVYQELGGHAAVAGELAEDVALARKAKRAGAAPRVALASDLATVRQHAGTRALIAQWSRNFYGVPVLRPIPILAGLAFLGAAVLSLLPAGCWTIYRWLELQGGGGQPFSECLGWTAAVVLHLVLMTACLAQTYRAQHLPLRTVLAAPLGVLLLLATLLKALATTLTGRVTWRGRPYTSSPAPPAPNATPHRNPG